MRQIASFLLTALILVNLFGFYTLFILERTDIRNEMAEKVNNCYIEHQVLNFDAEQFSKLVFDDNGKEFSFGGRLYDVVSIKHEGRQVEISVDYDAKETDLVEGFKEAFAQHHDKDQASSPLKTIISHFQQNYIADDIGFQTLNAFSVAGYITISKSNIPLTFLPGKLTPPPQFFLV